MLVTYYNINNNVYAIHFILLANYFNIVHPSSHPNIRYFWIILLLYFISPFFSSGTALQKPAILCLLPPSLRDTGSHIDATHHSEIQRQPGRSKQCQPQPGSFHQGLWLAMFKSLSLWCAVSRDVRIVNRLKINTNAWQFTLIKASRTKK